MKSIKKFALAVCLALLAINTAQAVPVSATIQGSGHIVKWTTPSAGIYKLTVKVPSGATATNVIYQIYPNGNSNDTSKMVCSSTNADPCFEATVNQAINQGQSVVLKSGTKQQWSFSSNGYVSVDVNKILNPTEQLGVDKVKFTNLTLPGIALKIGGQYAGGIIFYLDSTKLHGLVAAPTDIKDASGNRLAVQWYNGSYIITGATGTGVGTGKANTAKIIASQGAGTYAAKLCDDLVEGGYDDWYLPSLYELQQMANIGGLGMEGNVWGFTLNNYWSSSEVNGSAINAFYYQFFTDSISATFESVPLYVRAVRSF